MGGSAGAQAQAKTRAMAGESVDNLGKGLCLLIVYIVCI